VSYDIAVWEGERPASDEAARVTYDGPVARCVRTRSGRFAYFTLVPSKVDETIPFIVGARVVTNWSASTHSRRGSSDHA
jgi:hypothetical protein